MGYPHQFQGPPSMNFGQKVSNVANTMKSIHSIGSAMHQVGKVVAPFVRALLEIYFLC